jgi:hypothetical protein
MKERIEKITNKENRIIFFVPESENAPLASIGHIYEIAKVLHDEGYNISLLKETATQTPITWLGEEYEKLPHIDQSQEKLSVAPEDFIIVPDIAFNVVKKLNEVKVKSKIVILAQGFDFIFEPLEISDHWLRHGVDTVITTSSWLKDYIADYMLGLKNFKIISPYVADYFKPYGKNKVPTINVVSRKAEDIEKFAKLFYLKYPEYSFVLFKHLNGFDKKVFAKELSESILSIWMDKGSSFGTFPLESMACDVPVLGLIPDIMPEWMINKDKTDFEKNGLWVNNVHALVKITSDFISQWITNSLDNSDYKNQMKTAQQYDFESFKKQTLNTFKSLSNERINFFTSLENQRQQKSNLKVIK